MQAWHVLVVPPVAAIVTVVSTGLPLGGSKNRLYAKVSGVVVVLVTPTSSPGVG